MATNWNGRGRRPSTTVGVQTARRLRQTMTPQEVKVWNWLRQRVRPLGYHFRRQARISGYVVDFACLDPKLVIEIDGDSHATGRGPMDDQARDAFLENEGFKVLRIWNSEIDRTGDIVVDRVLSVLSAGTPSP